MLGVKSSNLCLDFVKNMGLFDANMSSNQQDSA